MKNLLTKVYPLYKTKVFIILGQPLIIWLRYDLLNTRFDRNLRPHGIVASIKVYWLEERFFWATCYENDLNKFFTELTCPP